MIKLGLDIGNSTVKGAVLDNDNRLVETLRFPSAVTIMHDEKYLTFNEDDDFYIRVDESTLDHFDGIVAIGDRAVDLPGYQEFDVTATSYKANHPLSTTLLFGTLAPFVDSDVLDVKVALSIPIIESKTIKLSDDYKNKLIGEHTITIFTQSGSRTVMIRIVDALVMNEGQAGFLGMLDTIDTDFRESLNTVYRALGEDSDPIASFEDFLIIDIGEGTTDLAVFRRKRFNAEYSYSVARGYGNLLEDAMKDASREGLTIESRKELQQVLENTNSRRVARQQRWMGYVEPTKQSFIDHIIDTVLKTYGTRDYFDAIIFIGGGFSALTGYTVDGDDIAMRDDQLFTKLEQTLVKQNKSADLIFGIPSPYAQGINQRGLTQVLTAR